MGFDDTRLQAMLRGRRDVRPVPFPGFGPSETPIMLGVRVLQDQELDDCQVEAMQYAAGMAKRYQLDVRELMSVDAAVYEREKERQVIYRAFMEPTEDRDGVRARFFSSPQDVRQLDVVMQEALFLLYMDHREHVNPSTSLTEEEVDTLGDLLGKGSEPPAALGLYDVRTLRSLVRILARRLASLLPGK